MHVVCRLRELRGKRSLRDMQQLTIEAGCEASAGMLSQIERGVMLPPDRHIPALEQAYGAPAHEWYPAPVLLVIQADPEDV